MMIDNQNLYEDGVLREGLQINVDYGVVNGYVWILLYFLYGC